MFRGLFVTGTDTGVGKTVVSAALALRFQGVSYWKPVQTGIEQDDDAAEVHRLAGCPVAHGIGLPRPVSPHLAARWSGVTISVEDLRPPDVNACIVEGAGGVLVPLNDSQLMADLMYSLDLPVVVVARTSLGTINHTLLTLEALRSRSLCVAGVVMVGESNVDNRAAIEHYGQTRVLSEMPWFQPLESARLAAWAAEELDPSGVLAEWLE
ncbi:MAG: dethiobiotin synthase [Terriglobia bacterium]|nr:MAG: dethiobiotin synthase [Terriglobia bacterium]